MVAVVVPAAGSRSNGTAVDPSTASTDVGRALALQEDGKIVLAGVSVRGGRYELAIVRYQRGGGIDTGFGTDGIVLAPPLKGGAAIATQKDGKFVLAGEVGISERQSGFGLARYTRHGRLDATFGRGGTVVTPLSSPPGPTSFALASPEAVVLRPDGRIVAAGYTSNVVDRTTVALARYTARGVGDSSFGRAGKVVALAGIFPHAAGVQRDGRIVVVGSTRLSNGGLRFAVVRFTSNGELDRTFAHSGKTVAPALGYSDDATAIAIQPDGKLVVAGSASIARHGTQLGLARFLPNGTLDTDFGSNGTVMTNFAVLGQPAVALQPDGKIVVACELNGPRAFGVGRYEVDGSLDQTFGDGGKVRTRLGHGAAAHTLAIQPDGKIVVGGSSDGDFALARYTRSGELDTSFGTNGTLTTPFGSAWLRTHTR